MAARASLKQFFLLAAACSSAPTLAEVSSSKGCAGRYENLYHGFGISAPSSDAPVVEPSPVRTPTPRPAPSPGTPSTPSLPPNPRRAPARRPGRVHDPVEVPRDMNHASDYFTKDELIRPYWEQIPVATRTKLLLDLENERNEAKASIERRYFGGTPQAEAPAKGFSFGKLFGGLPRRGRYDDTKLGKFALKKLFTAIGELHAIDRQHAPELEAMAKRMVGQAYGADVRDQITIKLGDDLPKRKATNTPALQKDMGKVESDAKVDSADLDSAPGASDGLDDYVMRREFFNMMAQAQGMHAMANFGHSFRAELAAIDPKLPDLMLRIDEAFDFAKHHWDDYGIKNARNPDTMYRNSFGREIVTVDHQKAVDPETGEEFVEVKKVTGVAVGRNSWVMVHEAMKAGFEMKAALMPATFGELTTNERLYIDARTNSPMAEIRQVFFGKIVSDRLEDLLKQTGQAWTGRPLSRDEYFLALERFFTLLNTHQVQHYFGRAVTEDLSSAHFRQIAREFLEVGVFGDDLLQSPKVKPKP